MLGSPKYYGIQRIHENLSPRLGGLTILLEILVFYIFSESFLINYEDSSILFSLLLFGGVIALLPVSEDIYHNTSPIYRSVCISISTFLFFYGGNYNLPLINMPILEGILSLPIFALLFNSFAVAAVSNGFNLIDEANALDSMTLICSFFCLLFLSVSVNDLSIAIIAWAYILFILVFLGFNYPFGKFF